MSPQRKPPHPRVIAAVAKAMRAGHTETPGMCLHTDYSSPTVRRALDWMAQEGYARCVTEARPHIPGKSWKGVSHVWTLQRDPVLPDEPQRDTAPYLRREPWEFGLLVAAYSRPAHTATEET